MHTKPQIIKYVWYDLRVWKCQVHALFTIIVSQNKTKQPEVCTEWTQWRIHGIYVYTFALDDIRVLFAACVSEQIFVNLYSHSIQFNWILNCVCEKKRCVFVRQHIKYHFILLCLNLIRVFYSFRSFIMWFNFDIIPILIIHLYISFRQKKKTLLIRLFNDKYVKFDERHKMYAQNGWMFFRKQTVSLVKTSKQTNELETKNFSLNLDCHQLSHTRVKNYSHSYTGSE